MSDDKVILSMDKEDYDRMVKVIDKYETHKRKVRETYESKKTPIRTNKRSTITWNVMSFQHSVKSQ